MKKYRENDREKGLLRQVFAASQVGIQMVASTFAGLALGYGLDKLFGTSPWCTIIFLILGTASGFVFLFRTAMRQARDDENQRL